MNSTQSDTPRTDAFYGAEYAAGRKGFTGAQVDFAGSLEVENARLRKAGAKLDLTCACDVLNPCFDNRPTDAAGKHWGGGCACAPCTFRAALAVQS